MKIGIDARFVGPQGTGLGKYTEKLIDSLKNIDNRNSYVVFLQKTNWDYLDFSKNKNFAKELADIPWYSLAEQTKLPFIFKKAKLDLLHVPHFNVPLFYKGKFIVTIHDLIHHQFTETSATTKTPIIFRSKRFAYRLVVNHAIKNSERIIVPSNFVKDQVLKQYNVPDSKIVVTYEAAEDEYKKTPEKSQQSAVLKKYKIKTPFIIYVGNAYPHKNLDALLLSLNKTDPKLSLVIVCSRDIFAARLAEKIKSLNLEDRVTMTGYVTAANLSGIFKSATAYVFPTLSEGFGIPGLNAMEAGIVVIASDIPTLREIYGEACLYFDPQNPSDIAEKIEKVLKDSKLKAELIARGKSQVKKYSWESMAKATQCTYLNSQN